MSLFNTERLHDILCLSHLRWNFVFQRPQHLMSRFAKERRVFFVEEAVFGAATSHVQAVVCPRTGVNVVTPHLSHGSNVNAVLESLLSQFMQDHGIVRPVAWYYTPMALEYVPSSFAPSAVVYDCMDELSMFKNAPSQLQALEKQLLHDADVVFTGGVSLFEAKRHLHRNIFPFPSGVDVPHFSKARNIRGSYPEHAGISSPRMGFAGVIDERMDLGLLAAVAEKRPDWQFVMIGPVVKIEPESLPRTPNIHWLGMKTYDELPGYFAGWDVAVMPFALNDSTRYISPTKTPEFLAAGLPVVSTAVRDVVRPYGELGLVKIAHNPEEFADCVEHSLCVGMTLKGRARADQFLGTLSWDSVWSGMNQKLTASIRPSRTMAAGSVSFSGFEPEPVNV